MRTKFLAYAAIVVLLSSMASWGSMSRRAMGVTGRGGGFWYGGGTGGGWAGAGGGGHK